MKKMCKILALAAFTIVWAAGCQTRITAEKYPEVVTPIQEVVTVNGKKQVITKDALKSSGGWRATARSPLWATEDLKGLNIGVATNGTVTMSLDAYSRDLSTNAVTMAHNLVTDFALLAEKVVEAYVTAGGSAVVGGTKTALEKAIANYIAKGGNAKNATITFANGNGTITDGIVTEVCTNCAP